MVLQARLGVVDLVAVLAQNPRLGVTDLDVLLHFLERLSTYRADFLLYMNTLDMFLHIRLPAEGAVTPFYSALDSGGGGGFRFGLSRFQDGQNHRVPLLAFLFQRFNCVGIGVH